MTPLERSQGAGPRRAARAVLLMGALLGCAATASAAPPARSIDDPSDTDFIATTERNEDPLGIESRMEQQLEEAADEGAERERRLEQRPALTSRQGQVLGAIGAVRESAHDVRVGWQHGLQDVEVTLQLESRSRFASEVSYRLALPEGARVMSVSLCDDSGCREARPEPHDDAQGRYLRGLDAPAAQPVPALFATRIVDAHGPALALRVAPLGAESTLEVRVRYGLEQPVRGGHVRLQLPARGFDPRTAPSHVHVEAPDLALADDARELVLDAWLPLELPLRFEPRGPANLSATLRVGAPDGRRLLREWTARPLPRAPGPPLALWVFADRSPSMEGPARGHVLPVLAALRAQLPAGSQVRVVVFDDTAEQLPDDPGPAQLRAALLQPEGAKTRLSTALALARGWPRGPLPVRAVILSDGRLSTEPGELQAARRFRHRGIPTWLVGLELKGVDPERRALFEALDARHLAVAPQAERALVDGDFGPLRERLSPVLHAGAGAGPPAGEQAMQVRAQRGRARPDTALARLLDPRPPEGTWTTLPATGDPALWPAEHPPAPAAPYLDAPPAEAAPDTGMPAESVLGLLRDQLVPKARACLRRDRRGRADYAVRAAFVFRLERREILDARVQGQLTPALRSCLREVLAALRVPSFTGRLKVRYPIYTERAPEPPQIELEPDAAARIERLFQSERPP